MWWKALMSGMITIIPDSLHIIYFVTQFWPFFSGLWDIKSNIRKKILFYQNFFLNFISHNSDFLRRNCEEKKSELWDKKSQLPFLFLILWRKWASLGFGLNNQDSRNKQCEWKMCFQGHCKRNEKLVLFQSFHCWQSPAWPQSW